MWIIITHVHDDIHLFILCTLYRGQITKLHNMSLVPSDNETWQQARKPIALNRFGHFIITSAEFIDLVLHHLNMGHHNRKMTSGLRKLIRWMTMRWRRLLHSTLMLMPSLETTMPKSVMPKGTA